MKIMRTYRYTPGIFLAALLATVSVSCGGYEDSPSIVKEKGKGTTVDGTWPMSISASQNDEGAGTRAVLSGGQYLWSPDDVVRLTITPGGSAAPIAEHVPMVSTTGGADVTFEGLLDDAEMAYMSSANTYDYYSYFFPGTSDSTFPDVTFTIPSSITVSPDVFNPAYAPMVAAPHKGESPIIYLTNNELQHGDLLHFDYKHVMSYAAIEMDVRLLPELEKVTSIKMTNTGGTWICGTLTYDMSSTDPNYTGSYTSGGNSLTVNISGGLTAGNGNVIYVPMPPVDMRGQTFTFEFTTSGTNKYLSKTIASGADFKAGKIHKLQIAPAAAYSESTNFTINKEGYYYIEAWGGDGGTGGNHYGSLGTGIGGAGGKGLKEKGLYYFYENDALSIQVGTAGSNGGNPYGGNYSNTGGNAGAKGSGAFFGSGYAGGKGGNAFGVLWTGGGGGGGGGAASGVLCNGTGFSNIVIASGGGGGGAGAGGNDSFSKNTGGYGGAGGDSGSLGTSATSANGDYGRGGNGYSTNYTDGVLYDSGSLGGNTGGATTQRGGGGGGGGGGGWSGGWGGNTGGGGKSGTGGNRGSNSAGGGGAGGQSSSGTQAQGSSSTLPDNQTKPSNDGYVIITFLR